MNVLWCDCCSVTNEGGTTFFPDNILATYPLVQIQGNRRLILEYYPKAISPDGHYQVRWVKKHTNINCLNQITCSAFVTTCEPVQVARAPLAGQKQPAWRGDPRNDDGGPPDI